MSPGRAGRKVDRYACLYVDTADATPRKRLKLFVSPNKALGEAADTNVEGVWDNPNERIVGPKNWRVFQKASDAGEIKAEITEAILQEQQKAKEEDDNEAFYVTGRGPVRLAVKSIIVVGLGETEIQTGYYNRMQKLATADEAAARSLMATLAPNITAATTADCAAKFDMMAKRRNLLCHPDDVEELDELVESAAFAFAKSQKLRDTLKNEYHLISNYQIARPYLCQIMLHAHLLGSNTNTNAPSPA